jgi:hypothetical protein
MGKFTLSKHSKIQNICISVALTEEAVHEQIVVLFIQKRTETLFVFAPSLYDLVNSTRPRLAELA